MTPELALYIRRCMKSAKDGEPIKFATHSPLPKLIIPDSNGLKPCPFCGGKAFISAKLPYFGEELTVAIVCENCNASSKHRRNEQDAKDDWNRRC